MSLINVRIAKITQEAEDIRSFILTKVGLFNFPQYTAGSHIDVHCGDGIIRQYSLCGNPNNRRQLTIAVKKVEQSRGGSDLMHKTVKEGDRLEIGSPRNNFLLDEALSHGVLLAAGIGVTPIIAMADRLHTLDTSFELHYFSRGPEHTAFRDRLLNGEYKEKVRLHEALDINQTQVILQSILANPISDAQVYMCGPGPFMDACKTIALVNWPAHALKLEHFVANPALAGAPNHPFKIELARRGLTLEIDENETILEVLDKYNIDVPFSCEQGVCGTCVTQVVMGEPEHRDSYLSDKQKASQSQMCLCVSRARSEKLVLDL